MEKIRIRALENWLVIGNLMPKLMRRLMDNDEPELNSRLQPIMAWLFHTPSPNALNTVLSMTGSIKPVFRLPYYPVNRKERQYIYDLLIESGALKHPQCF